MFYTVLGEEERPRRHRGRARVGQGADPLRGRQAARHAARADAGVHPRRAARDRPAHRARCWPRPGSPTQACRAAARRGVRRGGRPVQEAARGRRRSTSRTTRRRRATGLVVVDKPGGMTSHDVVARVRRLAGTRKVGHAGTLDPMATGVLVLGVNRATRLLGPPDPHREGVRRDGPARRLDHHRRRRGRGRSPPPRPCTSPRTTSASAAAAFVGDIEQVPVGGLGDQGRRQARLRPGPGRRAGRAAGPSGHRARARGAPTSARPATRSTSTSRCGAPAAPTSARSPATSAAASGSAGTSPRCGVRRSARSASPDAHTLDALAESFALVTISDVARALLHHRRPGRGAGPRRAATGASSPSTCPTRPARWRCWTRPGRSWRSTSVAGELAAPVAVFT